MAAFQFEDQGIANLLMRKFTYHNWELGLLWGLLNLGLALLVLLDIYSGVISKIFISPSSLLWHIESGLLFVFLFNFVYDVVIYLHIRWSSPTMVTKSQRSLMGINLSRDRGFIEERLETPAISPTKNSPTFPVSNFFYSSTPKPSPSSSVSGLWSNSSPSCLPVNLSETSMLSVTSSWDYLDGALKYNQPFLTTCSPMKTEDFIVDEKSLSRFLRERGGGEEILDPSKEAPFGTNSSASLWSQSFSQHTLSPIKTRYQISTRSPKFNSSNAESDELKLHNGVFVWSKIGVAADRLIGSFENLRKWISKTIISRLVMEIASVNDLLRWQGTSDLQIGEASLNALKLRAKSQNIPSFMALLHYLDLTANQEYLVQRLKDLERGGCMSDFRWDGGAAYKGKPWGEHLPTDSAIVMHLFFTYLDTYSPLSVSFPEGRAVTSKHFTQTPEKLDITSKDALYIYQSTMNPPHYQFVVGEMVYELQKGRNNMFSAILLFLHHIKVKEDGILKRINFGPSGINILWVIND